MLLLLVGGHYVDDFNGIEYAEHSDSAFHAFSEFHVLRPGTSSQGLPHPGGVRLTAHLRQVRYSDGRRPDPVYESSLGPICLDPHAERHPAQVLAQRDPAHAAGGGLRGRLRQDRRTPAQSRLRPAGPAFARTRPGRQWLGICGADWPDGLR